MSTNGRYRFFNLYEIALDNAKTRGGKKAIFVDKQAISYSLLLKRSDALAGFLSELGVKKGDRVALFLSNSAEFVYAVFAISKIGGVIVPVNTFLKSHELSYILQDCNAKALLASNAYEKIVLDSNANEICSFVLWDTKISNRLKSEFEFNDIYAKPYSVESDTSSLDENAVIFYTSGTTGKPKGAMLSNKNILSNADSGRDSIDVTHKDRCIIFLPMFHSFTFSIGLMLPLYAGASIVIIRSIRPFSNIFKQTLIKRVTIFFGVPDVYSALAKAKLPWYFMIFNRIRAFISGASALSPKTLDAISKKFKRATLLEGYGLSEASPAACINTYKKQKAGSVGVALRGYEVKIVDERMNELDRGEIGEIILKGDNVMMGYLNHPDATQQSIVGGWLLTGDMGYMDEEDFIFIVDRKKDLIISKGINIYPREIEVVIDRYDGVKVSAVVGIADEQSGEIPVAYLELEDGCEQIDESSLKRYLRENLANYKIPKQFHIIKELPKNATGKVLKRELKNINR